MSFIPVGFEFQVNTYTQFDQGDNEVTALPDGGFVVVWESDEQDGDNYGIFGQRYNAAGKKAGAEFQVNSVIAYGQADPDVAAMADGGWLVTWHGWDADDLKNGPEGSSVERGLMGQRYDADGLTVGGQFQINTTEVARQYAPAAIGLSDGSALVFFTSDLGGGTNGILAQKFDTLGNKVGGEFSLSANAKFGDQDYPEVTALKNGGFVVTWAGGTVEKDFDNRVFAQFFDADGLTSGNVMKANQFATGGPFNARVAALEDGGFALTWTNYNQDESGRGVFARSFDADGKPTGREFQVSPHSEGDQRYSDITALNDGGFVISWTEPLDQDGSFEGIFAQRYDADSKPIGTATQVNTFTNGYQGDSKLTVLEDGSFVVIWESSYQDGSGMGVFGQIFQSETYGTSAANSLAGTKGADILSGLAGSDILKGGKGADVIWGNSAASNGLSIKDAPDAGDKIFGGAGRDTLYGNQGNDIVKGGAGNDLVFGGRQSDKLFGNGGNDRLDGGLGQDKLTGGGGADTFVFGVAYGTDTIKDFKDNKDTIELDETLWGGGLSKAKLLKKFAEIDGDDIVLDFGPDALRIEGFSNMNTLKNDIDFI